MDPQPPLDMSRTPHPVCQEELYDPGRDVSINPNENSILTPQRAVPDVRLGYTSTGQSKIMQGRVRAVVSHERPFGWLLAYEFSPFREVTLTTAATWTFSGATSRDKSA